MNIVRQVLEARDDEIIIIRGLKMEQITIVYTGGQGELITEKGIVIKRGEPVLLPKDLAEYFLAERPDEFQLVDAGPAQE